MALKDRATVKNVKGCADNPCKMGMPANDIRPVVNTKFLKANPAVKTLLEEVRIPLQDIFAQNAKMQAGQNKEADIERHADEWIASHQKLYNSWLAAARKAAK